MEPDTIILDPPNGERCHVLALVSLLLLIFTEAFLYRSFSFVCIRPFLPIAWASYYTYRISSAGLTTVHI